jgi:hypothetical protein
VRLSDCRLLPLSVGLAFNDELERRALESIHRALGEQRVGHHGQDLGRFAIAGDNRAGCAVPFDDQFVEIAGLGRFEPMQREIVNNEQLDPVQSAASRLRSFRRGARPPPGVGWLHGRDG